MTKILSFTTMTLKTLICLLFIQMMILNFSLYLTLETSQSKSFKRLVNCVLQQIFTQRILIVTIQKLQENLKVLSNLFLTMLEYKLFLKIQKYYQKKLSIFNMIWIQKKKHIIYQQDIILIIHYLINKLILTKFILISIIFKVLQTLDYF